MFPGFQYWPRSSVVVFKTSELSEHEIKTLATTQLIGMIERDLDRMRRGLDPQIQYTWIGPDATD